MVMTKMRAREKASYLLKCFTVLSAFGGLFISFLESQSHGYSHWSKRFLYFTAQSNIWIGATMLALILYPLLAKKTPVFLYILKYIFTVSITLTFLVFTCLLGPFGDKSYHLWAFSSWLTHIFSPIFAIADFFVDEEKIPLTRGQVWVCVLPPLFYSISTITLEAFQVDFGRGVSYPYFFMDYRSSVGLFGFSRELPYFAGTFYWLALLCALILGIGWIYLHLRTYPSKQALKRQK